MNCIEVRLYVQAISQFILLSQQTILYALCRPPLAADYRTNLRGKASGELWSDAAGVRSRSGLRVCLRWGGLLPRSAERSGRWLVR